MKVFSLTSLFVFGAVAAAGGCWSGLSSKMAIADEVKSEPVTFERDYFVKGMTCGGCVFGVKKALSRAGIEKNQIEAVDYKKPDPEHKIGHAKVKFFKDQYKGQETDCKIIKEIKESPGYVAYWDSGNTDPCGLEKKN